MALVPAPFRDLVTRLYREPATQNTLFELPRHRWHLPDRGDLDLTVDFLGSRAGNPSGTAGPHTQMAQSILLSYLAGGRILELPTVRDSHATDVNEAPERPQGLCLTDALREYVAGSMLIELFRHNHAFSGGQLDGLAGAVIYEISVSTDLAGVRKDEIRGFLDGMRAAGATVERLRAEIPREFSAAREHSFPSRISDTVALSTLSSHPAEEIEQTCEVLIAERDFNVLITMSPAMLGRKRLENLLKEVPGCTELRVDPQARDSGPSFDQAVELCRRLTHFARQRGWRVGFRFGPALPVRNQRDSATTGDGKAQLSDGPLYVIALTLADEFRRKVGPHVPVSLCAGISPANFPQAVACGCVPVSAGTDLLRSGGYGRLSSYGEALTREMQELNAVDVDEFILRRFGQEGEARRRAAAELGTGAGADDLHRASVRWAGLLNTSIAAQTAREDLRYRAERHQGTAAHIGARTQTTVAPRDECIAACPNAANFAFLTPVVSFDYHDLIVSPDGTWQDGPQRQFEINAEIQLACYADFCDECGNCKAFQPEPRGPYADKPSFFGDVESWQRAAPRDGFVVKEQHEGGWIRGRLKRAEYQLAFVRQSQQYLYDDGVVAAFFSGWGHEAINVRLQKTLSADHHLDMGVYHTLRYLREGVLDPRRINQINVQWMSRRRSASGMPR